MKVEHISGWFELLYLKEKHPVPTKPSEINADHYRMVCSPLPLAEYEYPFDVLEMFATPDVIEASELPRPVAEGDILNVVRKHHKKIKGAHLFVTRSMIVLGQTKISGFRHPKVVVVSRPSLPLSLTTLANRMKIFRETKS